MKAAELRALVIYANNLYNYIKYPSDKSELEKHIARGNEQWGKFSVQQKIDGIFEKEKAQAYQDDAALLNAQFKTYRLLKADSDHSGPRVYHFAINDKTYEFSARESSGHELRGKKLLSHIEQNPDKSLQDFINDSSSQIEFHVNNKLSIYKADSFPDLDELSFEAKEAQEKIEQAAREFISKKIANNFLDVDPKPLKEMSEEYQKQYIENSMYVKSCLDRIIEKLSESNNTLLKQDSKYLRDILTLDNVEEVASLVAGLKEKDVPAEIFTLIHFNLQVIQDKLGFKINSHQNSDLLAKWSEEYKNISQKNALLVSLSKALNEKIIPKEQQDSVKKLCQILSGNKEIELTKKDIQQLRDGDIGDICRAHAKDVKRYGRLTHYLEDIHKETTKNYIGDYQVIKVLGSGSYGDVFLATKNGKNYAIKLLNGTDKFNQSPDLYQEAENWNRVQSALGNNELAIAHACQAKSDIVMTNQKGNFIQYQGQGVAMIMPEVPGKTYMEHMERESLRPSIKVDMQNKYRDMYFQVGDEKDGQFSFILPDFHEGNFMYDEMNKKLMPVDLGNVKNNIGNKKLPLSFLAEFKSESDRYYVQNNTGNNP
ncbi:protein kinase family protein [Facilibium subflavum]|uniref:hypothetical protein n=1 Tax=Facilibium subflavum TaxID=2219058 RepID=UPI000E64AFC9|nr:hypothetical protein [Facilibium subflavum]